MLRRPALVQKPDIQRIVNCLFDSHKQLGPELANLAQEAGSIHITVDANKPEGFDSKRRLLSRCQVTRMATVQI